MAVAHSIVRNIYTDEAGTSAPEPATVVVALLVHVDTQWLPVVTELRHLFEQVPAQYRDGFAFHANLISAANKYPDWKEKDRIEFMCSVMNVPDKFDIPIALGAVKRGALDWSEWPERNMTPEKVDHFTAFTMCMARADDFLRTYCGNEMGQVIAEDIPEMRRFLRRSLNLLRQRPLILPQMDFANDQLSQQYDADYRVERIVDEVHFMERYGAPFLQLADACAFGFRRFFAGQRYGDHYIRAILSDPAGLPEEWPAYSAMFFNGPAEGEAFQPVVPGQPI